MITSRFNSVHVSSFGNLSAQLCFCAETTASVLVLVSNTHFIAEISILSDAGKDGDRELRRELRNHDFSCT